MNKLITFIAAIFAVAIIAPVAQAGSSQRRAVGYNQCGDRVYASYRIISYQRCGTPNYGWVRDRQSSSCSRPGRCNHHGQARRQSTCHSSSGSRIGFTAQRVSARSSFVRRSSPSRSYRSSSRSRSRSCR